MFCFPSHCPNNVIPKHLSRLSKEGVFVCLFYYCVFFNLCYYLVLLYKNIPLHIFDVFQFIRAVILIDIQNCPSLVRSVFSIDSSAFLTGPWNSLIASFLSSKTEYIRLILYTSCPIPAISLRGILVEYSIEHVFST